MAERKREVRVRVTGRFTAWSWSRWSDHDQCPYRAGLKHLMKVKEPGSPAMDRGAAIHAGAQRYVADPDVALAPELEPVAKTLRGYRKAHAAGRAKTETRWAFDKSWRPLGDFFAPTAWLRQVVDYHSVEGSRAAVTDYKTGKVSDDRDRMFYQLGLYALGTFLTYPGVEVVDAALLYTDWNVLQEETYHRADLRAIQRTWVKRTIPLLTDTRFEPKPGNHCRWCPHSAAKGGPCVY